MLRQHHVNAVVAGGPTVGQDRAAESAGAAVGKAGCFVRAFSRNGHAHLLRAAGARIDHAQRDIHRRGRAGRAAGVLAAGVAAVAAMMSEASLGGTGRVESGGREETGEQEGGGEHGRKFHDVLSKWAGGKSGGTGVRAWPTLCCWPPAATPA